MKPTLQRRLERVATVGRWALLALCAAWAVYERPAPVINVRWRGGLTEFERGRDERQLFLASGSPSGGTWSYVLTSPTRSNIAALVAHPDVEDTHRIDRSSATITAEAGRSPLRVWWIGPLRGANSRRAFRVIVLVLGLVTLTSAWLSRPHRTRR